MSIARCNITVDSFKGSLEGAGLPLLRRIGAGHRRAVPLCCLLVSLSGMGLLRAEEYHFLRAVDIRMFCRPQPDLAASTPERIPPGDKIWVTRQTQVGQTTWYVDGFRGGNPWPVCWVYGPSTVEFNEEQPGPGWLAMLDHILARNDVKFEEYVEVDNALEAAESPQDRKAIDESGPIQFRRLQMIERMLRGDDAVRDAVNGDALKRAWILGHKELVEYYEPSGAWWLRKEPYRVLLERYKSEAWAEEIAWSLTPGGPGDECYSDCVLERIVNGPMWYLSRYPAGAHAHAAMKDAVELASYAAGMACNKDDPPDVKGPVSHEVVQKIRDSLAKITLPEKEEILRSLDEAERKCKEVK
jgi:hypothetical protein